MPLTPSADLLAIRDDLLAAAGLSATHNANRAGYWADIADAAEEAAQSASQAQNNIAGYMTRTALALEALSGADGAEENQNHDGLMKRIVDALGGGGGEGSWAHRFALAASEWSGGGGGGPAGFQSIGITTDLDSDIDDVTAIALAIDMAETAGLDLSYVIVGSANDYSAHCARVLLDEAGYTDTPVGQIVTPPEANSTSLYAQTVAELQAPVVLRSGYPDAATVMRTALASIPDGSHKIISMDGGANDKRAWQKRKTTSATGNKGSFFHRYSQSTSITELLTPTALTAGTPFLLASRLRPDRSMNLYNEDYVSLASATLGGATPNSGDGCDLAVGSRTGATNSSLATLHYFALAAAPQTPEAEAALIAKAVEQVSTIHGIAL